MPTIFFRHKFPDGSEVPPELRGLTFTQDRHYTGRIVGAYLYILALEKLLAILQERQGQGGQGDQQGKNGDDKVSD